MIAFYAKILRFEEYDYGKIYKLIFDPENEENISSYLEVFEKYFSIEDHNN